MGEDTGNNGDDGMKLLKADPLDMGVEAEAAAVIAAAINEAATWGGASWSNGEVGVFENDGITE